MDSASLPLLSETKETPKEKQPPRRLTPLNHAVEEARRGAASGGAASEPGELLEASRSSPPKPAQAPALHSASLKGTVRRVLNGAFPPIQHATMVHV